MQTQYLISQNGVKLDPCLTPCTQNNSTWMKHLNLKHWDAKEEKVTTDLFNLAIENHFLSIKVKEKKITYHNWNIKQGISSKLSAAIHRKSNFLMA